MSDLQILFPQPQVLAVSGRRVIVRPVQMRHFERFGEAAGALLSMLATASPAEIYAYSSKTGALENILGVCTSLPAWRIRRLPAAVAVELMIQVIKTNSGFFDQALVSAATALGGAGSRKS